MLEEINFTEIQERMDRAFGKGAVVVRLIPYEDKFGLRFSLDNFHHFQMFIYPDHDRMKGLVTPAIVKVAIQELHKLT